MSNLHFRMLFLIVLAIGPAMALIVLLAVEERHDEYGHIRDNAVVLTQLAASEAEQSIDSVHDVVAALANAPEILAQDPAACDALLARTKNDYPAYRDANFFATDPSGLTYCYASGEPAGGPMDVSERAYFKRTQQSMRFTVGEYQIGRYTNIPTLAFGQPAISGGRLRGYIFVSLPVEVINQRVSLTGIPANAHFTLVDRGGNVIASNLDAGQWLGKNVSESDLFRRFSGNGVQFSKVAGFDGSSRLYSYTPVGNPYVTGIYASVGFPLTDVSASVNRTMLRNLGLLAAIAVLALLVAWFGTDFLLRRPLTGLVSSIRQLTDKAYFDPLTGLANRALLEELLNTAVIEARWTSQHVGLLFIDLDGFKDINDTLGHSQGDRVLKAVGRRLQKMARPGEVVARLGGDEFVFVLPNLVSPGIAVELAERLLRLARHSFKIGGREIRLSASIGIAISPEHASDAESLLQRADEAMYRAKGLGKDTYWIREDPVRQAPLDDDTRPAMVA